MQRLLDEPGRFLAVSQLGLTVIGFFASAFAAVSLADQLGPSWRSPGWIRGRPRAFRCCIVTVVLALFTIVFAELVPKTLALANAERFAFTLSLPIEYLARALKPLIVALDRRDELDRRIVRAPGSPTRSRSAPKSCA